MIKGGITLYWQPEIFRKYLSLYIPDSHESENYHRPLGGLTGRWNADDGGIYYIHQAGSKVYWLGQSRDQHIQGASWSNVFIGNIVGDLIHGEWGDVPYGVNYNYGRLSLKIENPYRLVALYKTGGFFGSLWNRQYITGPTGSHVIE